MQIMRHNLSPWRIGGGVRRCLEWEDDDEPQQPPHRQQEEMGRGGGGGDGERRRCVVQEVTGDSTY